MKRRVQLFTAGFVLAFIFIAMLCGFMAVDFSTERYTPDTFGQMFLVTGVDSGGLRLTFLGNEYQLSPEAVQPADNLLESLSPWLPAHLTFAGRLTLWSGRAAELWQQEEQERQFQAYVEEDRSSR